MFCGQTENALQHMRQSYAAYEQLADLIGMARLKIKQAQINWYQNLEGLALFEEGLICLNEMGARRNVALWTVIYAMLKADEDITIATQKAEEGQALCHELGYQRGVAIAEGVLSRAALIEGKYTEALALAEAYRHAVQALSLAVEYSDALVWAGWACLALGNTQQAKQYMVEALQLPNYWRAACLHLTAVLLARRSSKQYQWSWQVIGFSENRYARHRSPLSQEILHRFLPQPMQNMSINEVAELKERGCHLNESHLYDKIRKILR
jgi:hypothetical protein